ncbi:MLO-like protein 7 [Zingiber officinale]|uniref:MLO-like protein 7 n=2 Tax=Zingiber officinale TaxID=94328 RepID=UPI001C4D2F22|nr:MLO-like protein 7 [Zingiber officinale]
MAPPLPPPGAGAVVQGGGVRGDARSRQVDCSIFELAIIIISLLLEKGLHHVGEWFIKRQKRTLFEVLEKVKAELMILGFISLLLTFSQDQIAKICVPKAVADSMLPCRPDAESTGGNKRRLLALVLTESHLKRRILAAGGSVVECPPEKEQLITATGLHQLHILIFFLAVFHVVNSALIMVLGRAKIHRWKDWEKDTTSAEYAFTTGIYMFTILCCIVASP